MQSMLKDTLRFDN